MNDNFTELLNNELQLRKLRNPAYSMNAFAKSLGVSSGNLSSILSGKRALTVKMIEKLGLAIGLDLKTIQDHQEKIKIIKDYKFKETEHQYDKIALDSFDIISSWYFPSMIIMLTNKNIGNDPNLIAQKLGLTVKEVKDGIKKLIKVGLVEQDEKGNVKRKSKALLTNLTKGQTSAAAKKHQKELLNKSMEALEELEIEKRDHSGMTLYMDPKDMEKAKEMIKVFRRKFLDKFYSTKPKAKTYQMQIGLFPTEKE